MTSSLRVKENHMIFKQKLYAKMEQMNQINLKKLPKRIRGTIRRSAKEILASDPEEDQEEEEEDDVTEDELEMRIQEKYVTNMGSPGYVGGPV